MICWTSLTVRRNCPTPRCANVSHCSGTITSSAAVSPFSVSTPSDGGQSMMTTSKRSSDVAAEAASDAQLGQRALERVLPTRPHQQHCLGTRPGRCWRAAASCPPACRPVPQRARRRRATPRGSTPRACRGPDRARTSDNPADPGRRAAPACPSPPSPHPTMPPSSSWRPHPFDWRLQVPESRPHPGTLASGRRRANRRRRDRGAESLQ